MKDFIDRLKELQGGRTQKEYARYLGVPLNTYTNWILRSRRPTIDALISIAKTEGVTTDWLLGLADSKTPNMVFSDGADATLPTASRDIERLRADAAQVCVRADSFTAAIENLKETLQRFTPQK